MAIFGQLRLDLWPVAPGTFQDQGVTRRGASRCGRANSSQPSCVGRRPRSLPRADGVCGRGMRLRRDPRRSREREDCARVSGTARALRPGLAGDSPRRRRSSRARGRCRRIASRVVAASDSAQSVPKTSENWPMEPSQSRQRRQCFEGVPGSSPGVGFRSAATAARSAWTSGPGSRPSITVGPRKGKNPTSSGPKRCSRRRHLRHRCPGSARLPPSGSSRRAWRRRSRGAC
jgi:hypothetical protein